MNLSFLIYHEELSPGQVNWWVDEKKYLLIIGYSKTKIPFC